MKYINLIIEYFKIFYKRTHMGQKISFKPYFYVNLCILKVTSGDSIVFQLMQKFLFCDGIYFGLMHVK